MFEILYSSQWVSMFWYKNGLHLYLSTFTIWWTHIYIYVFIRIYQLWFSLHQSFCTSLTLLNCCFITHSLNSLFVAANLSFIGHLYPSFVIVQSSNPIDLTPISNMAKSLPCQDLHTIVAPTQDASELCSSIIMPISPFIPYRTHHMIIWTQMDILKTKVFLSSRHLVSIYFVIDLANQPQESRIYKQDLINPKWQETIVRRNWCFLYQPNMDFVPRKPYMNYKSNKWIFKIKTWSDDSKLNNIKLD